MLTFDTLCQKLKECIQIETFNQDTLKTLNLYIGTTRYNNAAGILADKNHFPGIDMVRFGDHISILTVYEKGSEVFKDYYQYEEIQRHRKTSMTGAWSPA